MKTTKGMGFGFSTVNAGQRNVSVEPQVIAVSTEGSFRLTPVVTRVLGITHGEYVMFLSNIDNIDAAIATKADEVVNFCAENGLELGSPEAAIAIHKEFDMWAVAKGIAEYDSKGYVKTTTERLTKTDKVKFVTTHFEEMLEGAMASDNEEAKDALSREGITREEQIEILTAFVSANEVTKFKGSKCANPTGMSGAGVVLNFADTNVWKQLKADMGDSAKAMNRVFDVDVENIQDIVVNDGYKDVTVKALILGDYTDKEPARLGKDAE